MKTYNILLVEDDKTFSRILASAMETYCGRVRYKVQQAYSKEECLKFLRLNSYDCVLLDLNLSNSVGAATFTAINDASNKNIDTPFEDRTPIVVLTGDKCLDYYPLVREGAMAFIVKPVQIDDLCVRIDIAIMQFSYRKAQEIISEVRSAAAERK